METRKRAKEMTANELRIGNYVCTDIDDMILSCEITMITPYHVDTNFIEECPDDISYHQTDVGYRYIRPMPLTEEWLLKFGFVEEEYSGYIRNNGRKSFLIAEGQDIDDYIVLFKSDVGMQWCDVAFSPSVHELQNLYFALTGEELTIKT